MWALFIFCVMTIMLGRTLERFSSKLVFLKVMIYTTASVFAFSLAVSLAQSTTSSDILRLLTSFISGIVMYTGLLALIRDPGFLYVKDKILQRKRRWSMPRTIPRPVVWTDDYRAPASRMMWFSSIWCLDSIDRQLIYYAANLRRQAIVAWWTTSTNIWKELTNISHKINEINVTAMVDWIYICSAAHLGSTLLDLLLGSHSRVASLGEISKLLKNIALNT